MDRDYPEPQIFDPGQLPTPSLPDLPPGGGIVVLVVSSNDSAREWAERSALALASAWAETERRILLADLALADPGLHQALGLENGEGMSDAFFFGSSVLKVARPLPERGFLFVPAGTATASPEAVAASPRWASVVDSCDRIGATVVVFLPSDLPGSEHLLAQASDVFLLTDNGAESGRALPTGLGDRLRGVLVPPLEPESEARGDAPTADDDLGPQEAEPSVLDEPEIEEFSGTEPDPVEEEAVGEPRARSARIWMLMLFVLAALSGAGAAAWFGVAEVPWVSSTLRSLDLGVGQESPAPPVDATEEPAE